MATTTNYSWTTPDDTALVKDGAAAIRSLGTAIDTTVFNNASAAIAKTIVDAKGDIIAATAADTVARLAVGTNGQVLKANSATATGLEWGSAGGGAGSTLISTGTISAASSWNLPADSFTATYTNYQLFLRGKASGYGTNSYIDMFLRASGTNNTDADYYYSSDGRSFQGTAITSENNGSTNWRLGRSSQMINNFNLIITQPKASATTAFFGNGMVSDGTSPGLFSGNLSVAGHFGGSNSFDSLGFQIGTYTFTGNYYLYGLAE